jgi:uncharacterized protein (DUF1330 family)
MTAYFIAHRRAITDAATLKAYQGVDGTVAQFGGKVVVREDRFEVLEGDWHPGRTSNDERPERITVIEFPDKASLQRWYASPEYTRLKELRLKSSASDAIAVEETDGRKRG